MQHQQQHHGAATTPPPPHHVAAIGEGVKTTTTTSKLSGGGGVDVAGVRGAATSLRNRNRQSTGAPSPPIRVGNSDQQNSCCSGDGGGRVGSNSTTSSTYATVKKPSFEPKIKVATTGFLPKDQDRIFLAIQKAGHIYCASVSTSTHLLIVNTNVRNSLKFITASKNRIPCVTEDWTMEGKVPRTPNSSGSGGGSSILSTSGGAPGSATDPSFYPPCSVELLNSKCDCAAVTVTSLTWETISTSGLHSDECKLLGKMLEPLQIEITGSLQIVTKLLVVADTLESTLPSSTNDSESGRAASAKYTGSNMKITFALKKGIPIMTLTAFLKSFLPGKRREFYKEAARLQALNGGGSNSNYSSGAMVPPPPSSVMFQVQEAPHTIVVLSSSFSTTTTSPKDSNPVGMRIQQAYLGLGLVRLPVDVLLNPPSHSSSAAPCTYVLVDAPSTSPIVPQSVLDALNPLVTSKQADCIRGCYFVTLAWLWESYRQKQLLNPCGTITVTSPHPTSPSSTTTTTPFQWVPHYITLCKMQSVSERLEIIQAASNIGAVVLNELIRGATFGGDSSGGGNGGAKYPHHRPVSTTHIVCGLDTTTVPTPIITESSTCAGKTGQYHHQGTDGGGGGSGVWLANQYIPHNIPSKLRKVWSPAKGGWCHVVTPSWLLQSAALGKWVDEEPFTIHPPASLLTASSTLPQPPPHHKPVTTITVGEKRQREEVQQENPTGMMMCPPPPSRHHTTTSTTTKYHEHEEEEQVEEKDVIADALALLFDDKTAANNPASSPSALPSIANHCQTQNSENSESSGTFLSQITGTTSPPKMPQTPKQHFPYSLGKYDEAYGNNNNIQKMPSPPPKVYDSQHVVYHHDDGDCGPATNGLAALGELYKSSLGSSSSGGGGEGGKGGLLSGIFFGDDLVPPSAAATTRRSQPSEKPATIDIDDDDDVIPVDDDDPKVIESEHLIRAAQPQLPSTRHPTPTTVTNATTPTTSTTNTDNTAGSTLLAAATGRASSTTGIGRPSTTSMGNANVPTTAINTTNGGGGGVTHSLFIAKAARDRLPNNICTLVQDLGGEMAHTADSCTHYICNKPVKTETLLCCLASGKWILSPKYLDDLLTMHANEVEAGNIPPVSNGRASVSSSTTTTGGGGGVGGAVSLSVIGSTYYPNRIAALNEEAYEWSSALIFSNNSGGSFSGSSASLGTSTSALADACPRQRKSLSRCFSSWKVVLVCSVASRTTSFSKVLVAGGCTILASYTKEELEEAANNSANGTNNTYGNDADGAGGGSHLLAAATRASSSFCSSKKHRTIEIPPETTHVLCDDDALTTNPLIRPLVKTAILHGPLKAALRSSPIPGVVANSTTTARSGITTRLGSGNINNSSMIASATKYGSTITPHFHGALRMEFLVHALCVERQDPSIFVEIDFSA